jgi:hypothetical protein
MKNLRLLANLMLALAAIVCVGVFTFDRLSSVSAQRVNERWEHCFVAYNGTTTKGALDTYEGVATISYQGPGSVRIEDVKGTAEGDAAAASRNAFSQAVSRLGTNGWELAAAGPSPNGEQPVLYFKRQQK